MFDFLQQKLKFYDSVTSTTILKSRAEVIASITKRYMFDLQKAIKAEPGDWA